MKCIVIKCQYWQILAQNRKESIDQTVKRELIAKSNRSIDLNSISFDGYTATAKELKL